MRDGASHGWGEQRLILVEDEFMKQWQNVMVLVGSPICCSALVGVSKQVAMACTNN